ncbi:MAG: hypothetical protein ACYCX3_11560 [Thermoleophilia bacterium]
MIVQELIEELQAFDPEAEVRLAYQENYPLQDHVRQAVQGHNEPGPLEAIVWIVSAGQVYNTPYAPSWVFDAV